MDLQSTDGAAQQQVLIRETVKLLLRLRISKCTAECDVLEESQHSFLHTRAGESCRGCCDRGMSLLDWGGLAKVSLCGLPGSFDGVGEIASVSGTETRAERHGVLMAKHLFKCIKQ